MKNALVILIFGTLLAARAQTNVIIFPQLLSSTNTVLMTNAEFRTVSGSKIYFRNENGYQMFQAADLNTNVLAVLHLDIQQLELKQKRLTNSPSDIFFDLAQKKFSACTNANEIDEESDKIIQEINNYYFSAMIKSAEYNGATENQITQIETLKDGDTEATKNYLLNTLAGTEDNGKIEELISQIDRMRAAEKLKILNLALAMSKKELSKSQEAEQIAKTNLDTFNADPIGYLKTHPEATNSTAH